jgi:hypothetical protein
VVAAPGWAVTQNTNPDGRARDKGRRSVDAFHGNKKFATVMMPPPCVAMGTLGLLRQRGHYKDVRC